MPLGLVARMPGRRDQRPAVVTVAGPVTDPGQALRADRVEVALVEREIGIAVGTRQGPALTRRATGRALDDRRVVGLGIGDGENFAAAAVKLLSATTTGHLELAVACLARNQSTIGHGV